MFKLLIFITAFWVIYVNAHASTNYSQRDIEVGEIVIHHFNLVEIMEKTVRNSYLVRMLDQANVIVRAERNELSIMDGCLNQICVNDVVFDTGYLRYVTVKGISYSSDLIVESLGGWNGFYQPFNNNLAVTSGCHTNPRIRLCVGDRVKDFSGNIMTIIGLHENSKLVLRSNDGWNSYRTFVDPTSLNLIEK